ncbi:hypothetical protein HPULCUR_005062 [Helicostylum pulchrum]|uniref:Uncharacterized protein n=1 Tax=Helicostylum pulchrum TaxID=562976 RepID=A0ABP9XY73_9FUNG
MATSERNKDNSTVDTTYAIKLINAMEYIKSWLESEKLSAVTTTYDSEIRTKAYNTKTAKNFLLELLSTNRTGRLSRMLNHIYFETALDTKLVESLAALVMWSFGIPEERAINEFPDIESFLVSALSTARDSFVFDFVLYTLLRHDLEKTDVLIAMNTVYKKPFINIGSAGENSKIILKFMDSSFMRKNVRMTKPCAFIRSLKNLRSGIFSMCLGGDLKQIKIETFNEFAYNILNDLNELHLDVRVLDGKSRAPSQRVSNYSGFMPDRVDESSLNIHAEDTGEQDVTFRHNVLRRRINRDKIRSKLELLVSDSNLDLLRRKRNNPDAYTQLSRIQQSFRKLVSNLNEYEEYIHDYEKKFVLGRVYDICNLFELELIKVKTRNKRKEIGMLNRLCVQTTSMVWCLDQTYKKFLEFDNSYSRDSHLHINNLRQSVFKVNGDDAETENVDS